MNITHLHSCTNLLYLNVYSIARVKTFPKNMTKHVKIKAVAGLVHHLQPDMPVKNYHLLLQNWRTSPVERKALITKFSPTSAMGFDAENINLSMHLPNLNKRSCIPKHSDPSHLPTIFSERN